MTATARTVLLRAAGRVAVPWRNGGGLTREVAAEPAGSDFASFDWRVSLADVRAAGPFSGFPGVQRQLAVLEGTLALSVAGRVQIGLSPDSVPVWFAGDLPVSAAPLGPLVTDLNVMTRTGRCEARLQRHPSTGVSELTLCADTTVIVALSNLTVRRGAVVQHLSRLDALRFDGEARCRIAPRGAHGGFWIVSLYLPSLAEHALTPRATRCAGQAPAR